MAVAATVAVPYRGQHKHGHAEWRSRPSSVPVPAKLAVEHRVKPVRVLALHRRRVAVGLAGGVAARALGLVAPDVERVNCRPNESTRNGCTLREGRAALKAVLQGERSLSL